jgi:transposase
MQRITIGLDIAKSVFQVHGEDAGGKIVLQKRLRRSLVLPFFAGLEPALNGIEACGSAAITGPGSCVRWVTRRGSSRRPM